MAALDGVYQKIERARFHHADLATRLASVLGQDKQSFVLDKEPDPETVRYGLRVFGVPAIDPEWLTIIGDCLFNLRSALDHLAWQLVLLDGGQPDHRTSFPIRKARDKKPLLMPEVSRPDILMAVEAVQPYLDTGDRPDHPVLNPLWVLHRLNIIDKHRLLVLAVHTLNLDATSFGWDSEGVPLEFLRLNLDPVREEGASVAWFKFPAYMALDALHPQAALHLVINEQELPNLTLTGIETMLDKLIYHVEWMLAVRFGPLFPPGTVQPVGRIRPVGPISP